MRDYLMGHPSEDIDIATKATPDVILDLFPRTIPVGIQFGIVIVVLDDHHFEVATFRKDLDYTDGRKPKNVLFTSAKEDALRRDFTINGMFYDPLDKTLHDFVGGQGDIVEGRIRTIGDAFDRFREDRLRMIRAVRFAARFHFTIDPPTEEAIIAYASTLFPSVSPERIWQEFSKMAAFPCFDQAVLYLHRLKLLHEIFPSLKGTHLDLLKKRLKPLASYPGNFPTILLLLLLFPEDPLATLIDRAKELKVSNKELHLLTFAQKSRPLLSHPAAFEKSDWVKFYAHSDAHLWLDIFGHFLDEEEEQAFLSFHQQQQQSLKEPIERLLQKKPVVTSQHLRDEGIPPGKTMGTLLKAAEILAINENITDPNALIAKLKTTPTWPK